MPIAPAPGKLRGRRVVSSRVAWVTCKLELEAADDGNVGASTKKHRGICRWLDAGHTQDWKEAS